MTTTTEAPAAPEVVKANGKQRDSDLFDPAQYDAPGLKLDTIDDTQIDEIEIAITGTIKLNRKNEACCRLIRQLEIGKRIDKLELDGFTVGKAVKTKQDKETGWAKKAVLVVTARLDGVQLDGDQTTSVGTDAERHRAAD